MALERRPTRSGFRKTDFGFSWGEACGGDVQCHGGAGDRQPGAEFERRGNRSELYFHCHGARPAMARDHAGFLRHGFSDAQYRSGQDRAAHHAEDDGNSRSACLGEGMRHRSNRGDRGPAESESDV